jgi:hypothetical protein
VNLDDVAQELYGLSPEEFTEVRNARAKEIIASGDRELGTEVRKLPKPTVAAWLANMLVRTRTPKIKELVALGPELREAQSQGERADMRRVLDRRREIIKDLVGAASEGATEAGYSMGSQVQRQVEETLEAAVADPESAALLNAGTLSGPLAFIGFGGESATQRRSAKPQGEKSTGTPSHTNESGGNTRAAERALAKAAESLSSAQRAMESAKASIEDAGGRQNEASVRHQAATKELRDADRDRKRANQELEAALRNRDNAARHLKEAMREHKSRQKACAPNYKKG